MEESPYMQYMEPPVQPKKEAAPEEKPQIASSDPQPETEAVEEKP